MGTDTGFDGIASGQMTDDVPVVPLPACGANEVGGAAVLHIGGSSSRCGACGDPCDPGSLTHDVILGWGDRNGSPGCGVRWTHVSFDYIDHALKLNRMRSDLPLVDDLAALVERSS